MASNDSSKNGPTTSPERPTDRNLRVIGATMAMLEILAEESNNLAHLAETKQVDHASAAYVNAVMTICGKYLRDLHDAAVADHQQQRQLMVAKHPGLLDADGNPLNRQARRELNRKGFAVMDGGKS